MFFRMKDVFDEYANPVYIIRPIISGGMSSDFEYIYVNKAFCLFLGMGTDELTGHRFLEYFPKGEPTWLDAFVKAAKGRKHIFVNNVSELINKKMYMEIFHIEPDMCGCIIHSIKDVSGTLGTVQSAGNAENLDFLTGLRNRFYLSENKDEIEKKKNVGITYIDITHLKNTNKHHGRAAGDKLIKQVTDMLRSHYKNSTIFRMSGDEFVVITENCTKSDFLKLSEMGDDLFGSNKLAEIGYKFYETIDNLKDCIKQCESLMYKRKEDKNAAARAVTEVTPEVVSVSAL